MRIPENSCGHSIRCRGQASPAMKHGPQVDGKPVRYECLGIPQSGHQTRHSHSVPLGSPTADFYGADRHGDGLYGNSLVALDAATGKLKWYQQLVHTIFGTSIQPPPQSCSKHRVTAEQYRRLRRSRKWEFCSPSIGLRGSPLMEWRSERYRRAPCQEKRPRQLSLSRSSRRPSRGSSSPRMKSTI